MKTVAIISQKGGAGKTTLSLNLAGSAEAAGFQTVIVDLDPQASAKTWHDQRNGETPIVISSHASRLPEVTHTSKQHGVDLCIIDTAPHSETTALAAARAADLVLVPCRPAIFDLRAIASSVDLAQIAKKPALIVINAAPPRGPLADQAAKAIQVYGVHIAEFRITQRIAFVHSLTAGKTVLEYEPQGVAAREITALCKFICNHVSTITCLHDRLQGVNHAQESFPRCGPAGL